VNVTDLSGLPIDQTTQHWSIQQAAFHHQFDVETGRALWITSIGDHLDIKKRIEDLTGSKGAVEDRSFDTVLNCLRSSLAVHLAYGYWSTSGWRWYIEHLENKIEAIVSVTEGCCFTMSNIQQSQDAIVDPMHSASSRQYSAKDLQSIQQFTDKTNEAIMVMKGNLDIMARLIEFYGNLLHTRRFLDHVCGPMNASTYKTTEEELREHVRTFVMQLNGLAGEMHMHIARGKLLVDISADRNRMVSRVMLHLDAKLTNLQILQHLQGQATEKMQTMTSVSIKEAIVMRVITVVTLIFLPATFVSVSLIQLTDDWGADIIRHSSVPTSSSIKTQTTMGRSQSWP
jgi:hypothetical protein